ncbi:MAG TPA: hypothetical protein PLZ51_23055, partial [Aggregatilineales bacterium]|nr:hypothetical protein [Aggregatilineales bacterium]
ELLDEVLYLLAIMDCQKVLAKIPAWGIYAESDRDSNDYRIKHILGQIPKGVSNQSAEGQYPISYKGLRLDYSVRAENWVIITRGEGKIKYANFFVGDA